MLRIIKTTCFGPKYCEELVPRPLLLRCRRPPPSHPSLFVCFFFLPNTPTSWLRFSHEWNVGCQQTSPSKAAAPSSARSAWLCPLFEPARSLATAVHTCMHAHMHAEVKAVTSEGTVESRPVPAWRGSAPHNHPDASNQLGFSSPAAPTAPPTAAGLDSKHTESDEVKPVEVV